MTSNEMRDAVLAAWTETGTATNYPSQAALESAVNEEADRIEELIWQARTEIRDETVRQWRAQNGGTFPPYLEQVRIESSATSQATEIILSQELGESTTIEEEPTEEWAGHPDRWIHAPWLVGETEETIYETVEELWPTRDPIFQETAASLMQTLSEDSKTYPTSPTDPEVPQFTALIEPVAKKRAELRARLDANRSTSSR